MRRKCIYFSLLFVTCFVSILLAFTLKTDRLYTHFFYLPIALTAIWYSRYTLAVGGGFAAFHFIIEIMRGTLNLTSIARGVVIFVIAIVLGEIWKKEKKYLKEIHVLTYNNSHDFLTKAYNRCYFDSVLNQNPPLPLAIFICDIDNLKYTNDHLGHLIGDQLIVTTAQLLLQSFTTESTVARIGGDEFGILVPHCTIEQANKLFNNLHENMTTYNQTHPSTTPISFSTGYALCYDTKDISAVLKQADQAMYFTKNAKKSSMQ